ncbi:MAG TPA: hypothetical protein PK771_09815 [Spirochaetota bacterium]|nr:hypothetical protein [Spirochaetota bacterium]
MKNNILLFFLFVFFSCSTASSDKTLFDYFSKLKRTEMVEPVSLVLSKYSDNVKVGEVYKFRDNIPEVTIEYSDGTLKKSTFDFKYDFDLKCYDGGVSLENNQYFGYIYDKTDTPKIIKIKVIYKESLNYIDENYIKQSKIVTFEKEFVLTVTN